MFNFFIKFMQKILMQSSALFGTIIAEIKRRCRKLKSLFYLMEREKCQKGKKELKSVPESE